MYIKSFPTGDNQYNVSITLVTPQLMKLYFNICFATLVLHRIFFVKLTLNLDWFYWPSYFFVWNHLLSTILFAVAWLIFCQCLINDKTWIFFKLLECSVRVYFHSPFLMFSVNTETKCFLFFFNFICFFVCFLLDIGIFDLILPASNSDQSN